MSNFMPIEWFLCTILDYKNIKFKHLIEDIAIDLWSSWNFASMNDILKTYNPIVRFLNFTFNKKIWENFKKFLFKLVEIFSLKSST